MEGVRSAGASPNAEKQKQRNSPERAAMLAERAARQRARVGSLSMKGVPASINRHTGKPHEHRHTNKAWARVA